MVNGRTCHDANLKVGDQILIGDYHLVLIQPPDGEVECALTVQQLQPQEYEGLNPDDYVTRLQAVRWLRKRPLAWLLFIAVLLLCLGVPIWLSSQPEQVRHAATLLPTDKAWLAGPLHREHAFMADDCRKCHAEPFQPVRDEACLSCHKDVTRHVPAGHPAAPLFTVQNCASCHHEHNEQARVVQEDQRFCSSCHSVLATVLGKRAHVGNVTDFSSNHPDFRLSLLQPQLKEDGWQWLQTGRVAWTPDLKEDSHLKFDHAKHLDAEGIKNQRGDYEVLQCDSCHTPAADGFSMVPITMEKSCSRCHSLAFDLDNPQREVPHGDPQKVIASLREYFSTRFINEHLGGKASAVRRPGAIEPTPRLQKEGLEWVQARTMEVAQDMFERRACVTCHQVDAIETDHGKEWKVRPNRINQHWFKSSRFPHYKHRNEKCSDCHDAVHSTQSSDILMPKIGQCQDCHGGPHTEDKVLSMCVTCHKYHQQGTGEMEPAPPPRMPIPRESAPASATAESTP